jgi:DnaA-homolog protein
MTTEFRETPRQLPLPIRLRASSIFSSYYAGANSAAIATLNNLASTGPSPVLFLYGASGTGKTHLLQALCARATQQLSATYLPLRELRELGPGILSGAEQMHVICVDDVSLVAQDREWNRAVFNLHRELEERGGKLVLADEQAPGGINWVLRDLSSRVLAGTVLRLQPLVESEQVVALRMHAEQRGLELPDEVAGFLLKRLPRDMHSLCSFMDELDIASLTAQRKLTVPFVREVLGSG